MTHVKSAKPIFEMSKGLFTSTVSFSKNLLSLKSFNLLVTYSITKPATSPSRPLFLSTTNLSYASLNSSLLNKKPMYVVLASKLEDILVSFLYVRALYLVLPQFLQRYRAS
jgi:hypothetical protein